MGCGCSQQFEAALQKQIRRIGIVPKNGANTSGYEAVDNEEGPGEPVSPANAGDHIAEEPVVNKEEVSERGDDFDGIAKGGGDVAKEASDVKDEVVAFKADEEGGGDEGGGKSAEGKDEFWDQGTED